MPPETARALCAALSSPRLRLEPLGEHHAPAFYPALTQDEALYRWISMSRPASEAQLAEHWRCLVHSGYRSPDGLSAWPTWAVRRASDGQVLGRVDAELVLEAPAQGEASGVAAALVAPNLGYYFFSPFWGQGYASEAVSAVLAHLAGCGMQRCAATVTVGNQASARVLLKAGFHFHRILPGNDVIRGEAVDDEEYVWGLAG
ncbi:GNAT family N-acetyltransferase [Roseateles sp.]|jgi:ribosomal-protein-alanine N-acetyltransferase|uniref:GNAT family N-acetyltransferase n=1 Tax=Roseateles sp. TaxID=1971397 RepID=UPI00391998DC